jgi:hypothetical protein
MIQPQALALLLNNRWTSLIGKNGKSLSSLLLHALGHHPMQMLDVTSILIEVEHEMQ